MCIAKEIIESIEGNMNRVHKEVERLSSEWRIVEQKQQDLLHELEFATFNASRGYCLAKMLQDVR